MSVLMKTPPDSTMSTFILVIAGSLLGFHRPDQVSNEEYVRLWHRAPRPLAPESLRRFKKGERQGTFYGDLSTHGAHPHLAPVPEVKESTRFIRQRPSSSFDEVS